MAAARYYRGGSARTLSFAGIALMAACGTGRKFASGDGLNQPKDGGATDSTSAAPGAAGTGISEGTTSRNTDESMTALQYADGGLQGAELGACVEGETEPCGPENEDGICRFGVRDCVNGLWSACEGAVFPATRNCESVEDNDCNGEPDNTVDSVCTCVPGSVEPCDEHPDLDGRGPCRAGERVCISSDDRSGSTWGACEGSVGPADADSCAVAGDDANCDGTPNGGCNCVNGQIIACGPATESGICRRGQSTCVGSAFSECQGAIFPQRRDCSSAQDNDCDGQPDNTVDNACTCVPGDTEICGEHPGRDGNGRCEAGERTCVFGANSATSRYGACQGSVGPAGADSCSVRGDDSNCDGVPNTGCECLAGDLSTCAQQHGSVGVCGTRALQCGNDGRWPSAGSCAPSSPEICTNALDDDCDGQVNEAEACSRCVEGCFCEEGACAEIATIASGNSTVCALSTSGNVWCWGSNRSGEAGLAGFTDEPRPRRLQGIASVQDIAVGSSFACALQADQTVGCWGSNGSLGQLGDNGVTTTSFLPVQVVTSLGVPLSGIAKIVAGSQFACALRAVDGAVLCWGANVGDGRVGSSSVAVAVVGGSGTALRGVSDIEAGRSAAFARTGSVWVSWGTSRNVLGQGEGGELASRVANVVTSPAFATVGVGSNNGCGITALGQAHCWGNDIVLQGLGSGELESPEAFPILDGSRQIALGSRVGLALDASGVVRAFGDARDELAAGMGASVAGDVLTPTAIQGLSAVKQLTVGFVSACALQTDNTVRCWGGNTRGQIGNGTTSTAPVPVLALPVQ